MNIILKKNCDRRLNYGHLWVFSNELENVPKLEIGSIVNVISNNGSDYGKAFYNPLSLISCRLLKTFNEIDLDFFVKRIIEAKEYREKILPGESIYRLVFGESDLLPGLVIDKYEDYFAIQILSAGMENCKELIKEALISVFPETKGIIEKNFSKLRELEGLKQFENVLFGEIPNEFIALENKIKLSINILDSQKTGYFLDQKINRAFISKISNGLSVLDLYCNQGGFALNAAFGNAKDITGVDVSGSAIEQFKINSNLNNFNNCSFIKDDVSDFLKKSIEEEKKWDLVILDPPAFTKTKKDIKNAVIGYSRVNRLAMRCINNKGYLATGSCSQHISEQEFLEIVFREASKLKMNLKLVFRGNQSPDHPIISSMPETNYLKFFVFQILNFSIQ
jgi:23S rRNA (cytosine1962-C5)-methyltransferase